MIMLHNYSFLLNSYRIKLDGLYSNLPFSYELYCWYFMGTLCLKQNTQDTTLSQKHKGKWNIWKPQ